jgi:tetratricopeptide (TPR) repeat protein
MALAQDISSLILSLRKKVSINVRQPLSKAMIPILDKSFKAKVEKVKELILSETNLKSLEYITDTSGIISKKIKPNFTFPKFNTKPVNFKQDKNILTPSSKLSLQEAINLADQGNLPGAKEYCLKMIKEDDKNFEDTHWLGHIFEAEGDYLSAELYYTKALNLNHEFLENYISLSSLYTVLGRDMESEKLKNTCKKILFERTDLQTSYTKKGLDLKRLKNYLESEREIWVT